jgi:hypothetical protein
VHAFLLVVVTATRQLVPDVVDGYENAEQQATDDSDGEHAEERDKH